MPGRNDVAKILDEAIDDDANHGAGDWAMMDVVGRFMAASVKKTVATVASDFSVSHTTSDIDADTRILFIFDAEREAYSWEEAQQEYGRTQLIPGASNALTVKVVETKQALLPGVYDVYYV